MSGACGGVLVPARDGRWERRCFVAEEPDRAWTPAQLRIEADHYVPRSRWYEAGHDGYAAAVLHPVHAACQRRQGGMIAGPIGGRRTAERGVGIHAQTPEEWRRARRLGGLRTVASGHLSRIAVQGGRVQGRRNVESGHMARLHASRTPEEWDRFTKVGRCARWSIGRGRPCTCGQHEAAAS